jgi:hypothetical protein
LPDPAGPLSQQMGCSPFSMHRVISEITFSRVPG